MPSARLSSPPATLPLTIPISDAQVFTGRQKPLTEVVFLFVETAALAATRRTPRQLAALETALANFEAAGGSPAATLGFDYAFHYALAEASGNPYLADALQNLGPVMIAMPPERLRAGSAPGADIGPVSGEHRAVYEAVAAGDALAAAAAMRIHLAGSRRRLQAGAGGTA